MRMTLAMLAALVMACAARPPMSPVAQWIAADAVDAERVGRDLGPIDARFAEARVVGLGEATHGQHEAFELKRRLTLDLIRRHGFRLVAYEASAARALACEEFIQGRSDNIEGAIAGLGMLIWNVEENETLLRDLRRWNEEAAPAERVHFVGIDVQDPTAAAQRLRVLMASPAAELAARVEALPARIEPAVAKLWSGDAAEYLSVSAEAAAIAAAVAELRVPIAPEAALRATELRHSVEMFRSPGGRDRAMAEMLLCALDAAGEATKAVVWAHNQHVTKAPLRYLGSEELAMGGHLAAALGERYYSLGFLFGEGEFHANASDPATGAWRFERYRLGPPPEESLEAPFAEARMEESILDLRAAPRLGAVGLWLDGAHGQRWFGGYNIPPDYAQAASDARRLPPTHPRGDYDGLVYLPRTTAAQPRGQK
ncbi:MAG: erythromycin esterase family protein [Planctomycetes bacterium]|nr:erythromycin esterase family protein [Planctomycetota bacterium]